MGPVHLQSSSGATWSVAFKLGKFQHNTLLHAWRGLYSGAQCISPFCILQMRQDKSLVQPSEVPQVQSCRQEQRPKGRKQHQVGAQSRESGGRWRAERRGPHRWNQAFLSVTSPAAASSAAPTEPPGGLPSSGQPIRGQKDVYTCCRSSFPNCVFFSY